MMLNDVFQNQKQQTSIHGYRYIKLLGRGACGQVYLVEQKQTGNRFALKKIKCFGMDQYEKGNALNEARILLSMHHPHIIRMQDCLFDLRQENLLLILEYASFGELSKIMEKHDKIQQKIVWNILYQITSAIDYLHKHNVIHRDIKPANILQTDSGVYKLSDLGVSKVTVAGDMAKTLIGSFNYSAPEVFAGKSYDKQCDIYSLGVVIYELCSKSLPYDGKAPYTLSSKSKIKQLPKDYSQNLNKLINNMLSLNPKTRSSSDQIIRICRNYVSKIDKEHSQLLPLISEIKLPQSESRIIRLLPSIIKQARGRSYTTRCASKAGSIQKQLSHNDLKLPAIDTKSSASKKKINIKNQLGKSIQTVEKNKFRCRKYSINSHDVKVRKSSLSKYQMQAFENESDRESIGQKMNVNLYNAYEVIQQFCSYEQL